MTEYEKREAERAAVLESAGKDVTAAFGDKPLIPLRDVARWLGIKWDTILNKRYVPFKKLGGRYYVTRVTLVNWYANK